MNTARPHPKAMTIQPEAFALDRGRVTAAHTPAPKRMRMAVPKNSDRKICPVVRGIVDLFLYRSAQVLGAAVRAVGGSAIHAEPCGGRGDEGAAARVLALRGRGGSDGRGRLTRGG